MTAKKQTQKNSGKVFKVVLSGGGRGDPKKLDSKVGPDVTVVVGGVEDGGCKIFADWKVLFEKSALNKSSFKVIMIISLWRGDSSHEESRLPSEKI